MTNHHPTEQDDNYARVGHALAWLTEHYQEQPSLEAVAAEAGLSPHHFQRVFKSHVGVSPKKFIAKLSLDQAKTSLARDDSVLTASLDAGLSGPSRLHDLFITHEAMTPGQWKVAAAGLTIHHGWHPSPFGDCLIAAIDDKICAMGFAPFGASYRDRELVFKDLMTPYHAAQLISDTDATQPFAVAAFGPAKADLKLLLRATPFQLKVWEALLEIPAGDVVSYSNLAAAIGAPTATRAAASAVAKNNIAWLIPCHRVLRASGELGGFRWGTGQKRVMLAWEAANNIAA